MKHTCIKDDGGTPNRKCLACEAEQPDFVYDLVQHLRIVRSWSEHTFGPGTRTKGIIDHIKKELVEIEEKPHDLEEWIDVVFLGLDGAWRHGYTPEQIAVALRAKLHKNMAREWPDWRARSEHEAITHIKANPTPTPAPPQEPTISKIIRLREDIHAWIRDRLIAFRDETGMPVREVDIDMYESTSYGQRMRSWEVREVRIKFEV